MVPRSFLPNCADEVLHNSLEQCHSRLLEEGEPGGYQGHYPGQLEGVLSVGVNRPCEIHHHRNLYDLEDVYLHSAHLQGAFSPVYVYGPYACNQAEEQQQRHEEPGRGEEPDISYAGDVVAHDNYRQSGACELELGKEYVEPRSVPFRKSGRRGKRGDERYEDEKQDYHPYHLVSLEIVKEVPEPCPGIFSCRSLFHGVCCFLFREPLPRP